MHIAWGVAGAGAVAEVTIQSGPPGGSHMGRPSAVWQTVLPRLDWPLDGYLAIYGLVGKKRFYHFFIVFLFRCADHVFHVFRCRWRAPSAENKWGEKLCCDPAGCEPFSTILFAGSREPLGPGGPGLFCFTFAHRFHTVFVVFSASAPGASNPGFGWGWHAHRKNDEKMVLRRTCKNELKTVSLIFVFNKKLFKHGGEKHDKQFGNKTLLFSN